MTDWETRVDFSFLKSLVPFSYEAKLTFSSDIDKFSVTKNKDLANGTFHKHRFK